MQTQFPSMEIISIIQKLSPSFWQQPNHCHNYAELAFVTDGIGCFTINNISIPVKKGSIILIPPHLYHCFHDYSAEIAGILYYCLLFSGFSISCDELRAPRLYNICGRVYEGL